MRIYQASRLQLSLRSLLRNVFSILYVGLDVPWYPERLCAGEVAVLVRPGCQLAMAVNQESKFPSSKT